MPRSASARPAALVMLLVIGLAQAGDPPRPAAPTADEGFLEFLGRGEDQTAAFGEEDAVTKPANVQEDAAAKKAKDERSGTGKAP